MSVTDGEVDLAHNRDGAYLVVQAWCGQVRASRWLLAIGDITMCWCASRGHTQFQVPLQHALSSITSPVVSKLTAAAGRGGYQ